MFLQLKWNGNGVINQYKAAISGSLCYAIVGTATAWPSPFLSKMLAGHTPVFLDETDVSWMVSLMFLGHITSPIPSGYLMDFFGRKRTCLYLSVFPFASWVLIFFATSAVHLYIARFATGLWIGISSVIIPVYVGEIASTEIRSSLITLNNTMFNFGVIFSYIIGPFFNYYILAVACESVTVLFILTFLFMPESPYYFIKQNNREAAFTAMSWLRKGKSKENIEDEIDRIYKSLEEQSHQKGTLKDILFDKGNRKALIISVTFAVAKRLSGSGVLQAYTSITLPKVTMGVLNPDTCVIIIGCVSLVSSLASTALSAKFPRNILLTISCGGCALTMAVIAVWFYLKSFTSIPVMECSDIVFWSLVFYYIVFNLALGPIGTSIKGEVFPVNVRALSSSLITFCVAISAFLVNKFYLIIASYIGMYANYVIYSVSCALTMCFTWFYVPEMHNKSFEEIRFMLIGNKKQYTTNL